jgi:limonene 1,2-monooxygenase
MDQVSGGEAVGGGAAVVGTPDDMVAAITSLDDKVGGFGVVLGFAHDWANREATARSWELFGRYVIPAVNGYTRGLQESADYLEANKSDLMGGAVNAIIQQIARDPKAAQAMAVTMAQRAAADAAQPAIGSAAGAALPDPSA